MARIPETTWFIKDIRRSVNVAVRSRSAALIWENPAKYGRRKHRKKTPIRDCQPIKYTSKGANTSRRKHEKNESNNNMTVSSSIRWTSLDIRSITWPVVNFNNASLLRSSACETRNTYSISFTKQGFSWHNRCLWLRQVCELRMCLFQKKINVNKVGFISLKCLCFDMIKDRRARQPTIREGRLYWGFTDISVPPQGYDVWILSQIQVTAFIVLVLKLVMRMLRKSQKRIASRG